MVSDFWKTVSINSINPHIINKKVSGTKTIDSYSSNSHCFCDSFSKAEFFHPLLPGKIYTQIAELIQDTHLLEKCEFSWDLVNQDGTFGNTMMICNLRKLFSKGGSDSQLELEIMCFTHSKVTYYPINNPHFRLFYQIYQSENDVKLWASCGEIREYDWLCQVFMPKMKKWYSNANDKAGIGSNQLVDEEEYQSLYQQLKVKYGQEMVKVWPECTDPAKFVYEDVAIATYLLLIWRYERKKLNSNQLQSFLDIGCGNGLLVYILASEGHPGKGVDIRSRKIWAMYPPTIKLEVGVVRPGSTDLSADWLIGNHSDELTPWMAVFAAKFKSNYFVLPCCQFNFFGKFQVRKDSTEDSKYQSYLNFVEKVGNVCGFEVKKDRLKIPSTKRICFVGTNRSSDGMDEIEAFIKLEVPKGQTFEDFNWDSYFTAREPDEPVRNCTKIDNSVKVRVVKTVVADLLENSVNILSSNEKNWNAGNTVKINQLIDLISKADLNEMKNECGGVQTLLRNHSHIFVVSEGSVRLRSPLEMSVREYRESKGGRKRKKESIEKKKECWFFLNHPDGCPCSDEECRFIHHTSSE